MRVVDSNFDRMQARRNTTAKNQSQMSKIIPMLQIGSKAGPDDEQKLDTLEQRITDLQQLGSTLDTGFAKLWTMHKVSRERQIKRLTLARAVLIEIRATKKIHGTATAVRHALNELTCLREAAVINELEHDAANLSSCRALTKEVTKLTEAAIKKLAEAKRVMTSEESETTLRDPVFSPDLAEIIKSTNEQAAALPSLAGKPFVVARIPIIPVSKTGLSIENLRANGFVVASLGGYPVINNQLVIGVNPTEIEITEVEKASGATIPRARWLEIAEKVRIAIKKETRQKVTFVDERPHGHAGGAWFWVMLENELDSFAASFPGKSLQLRNWGFGMRSL